MSNNWATGTLKEAPYWREGMSPEEYEIERDYFNAHLEDFYKGIYVPLWKQKSEYISLYPICCTKGKVT